MVSVGPLPLHDFHVYSIETVIIELEGSPCFNTVLAMQFRNSTSGMILSVIPCAIITGLVALLKKCTGRMQTLYWQKTTE